MKPGRRLLALCTAGALLSGSMCASKTAIKPVTAVVTDANDAALFELGRSAFRKQGCIECHTREGKGGTKAPNLDVLVRTADPTYVRESILDPDARISHGFQAGVMPQGFGANLTEAEIDALQYYLSNLTGAEPPDGTAKP